MYINAFSLFQYLALHSLKSGGTIRPKQCWDKVSTRSCCSLQHKWDFLFYVQNWKTAALCWAGRRGSQDSLNSCSDRIPTCDTGGQGKLLIAEGQKEPGSSCKLKAWAHIFQHRLKPIFDCPHCCFQFTSMLFSVDAKLSLSKLYWKGSVYACPWTTPML